MRKGGADAIEGSLDEWYQRGGGGGREGIDRAEHSADRSTASRGKGVKDRGKGVKDRGN